MITSGGASPILHQLCYNTTHPSHFAVPSAKLLPIHTDRVFSTASLRLNSPSTFKSFQSPRRRSSSWHRFSSARRVDERQSATGISFPYTKQVGFVLAIMCSQNPRCQGFLHPLFTTPPSLLPPSPCQSNARKPAYPPFCWPAINDVILPSTRICQSQILSVKISRQTT